MAGLARQWTDAWNACDVDGILALVHPEFRMQRMKGDVIDREGLADAVRRQTYGAAMKLFPLCLYARGTSLRSRPESSTAMSRMMSSSGRPTTVAWQWRSGTVSWCSPRRSPPARTPSRKQPLGNP